MKNWLTYGRSGGVPLSSLLQIARRAYALKGTLPADPALRPLARMLTDEYERALDWPIPPSLTGGLDVITTIVMLPRMKMPGGFLGLNYFPVLVDPATSLALFVPPAFWTVDLYDEWLANTEKILAAMGPRPLFRLTPAAADAIREMMWEQSLDGVYVVVGRGRFDLIELAGDVSQHEFIESEGLMLAIPAGLNEMLRGNFLDYMPDRQRFSFGAD